MGTLEVTKRKMNLSSSLHLRSPVFLTWWMLIILTISMTISVMVGAVTISPFTVWKVTLSKISFMEPYIIADWSRAEQQIIWELRFPRVILAAVVGALVSVLLVFILSQVQGRISTVRLLLAGIAVSMMLSAVTSYIVISAPREEGIRDAMF